MRARVNLHELEWSHGITADWAYAGCHKITRLGRDNFILERMDHERQPLTHIGFFEDIGELLLVLQHDQKIEV